MLYSHNRNYAPKSEGTQENTKGYGRYVFVPERISFGRIHTYSRYMPKEFHEKSSKRNYTHCSNGDLQGYYRTQDNMFIPTFRRDVLHPS